MTARHRLAALLAVALLALAGCGNDPATGDYRDPMALAMTGLKGVAARGAAPATPATLDPQSAMALRQILQKDGQPILLVVNRKLKFAGLMAPYGQNGNVRTWSTEQYTTLSLRDDILIATRGFGPDLMSASAPGLAQIARGQGGFARRYYYLDGADQTQSYSYDCVVARDGAETITILAQSYETSRIAESCTGAAGSFKNLYWFDARHILRQSDQFFVPGADPLRLQRVID